MADRAGKYTRTKDKAGKVRVRRNTSIGEDIADSVVAIADLARGYVGNAVDNVRARSNDVEEQTDGRTRTRKYR